MTSVPVVIVGAGPTGASAAIELGRRGIECLVLDRWEDVYPQPRAVHLDDEVHRILSWMGVGEEFSSISRPGGGLRLVDRRMRVLGEFTRAGVSEANGHPRANMFDQPDLEHLLRDRLRELPSVTVRGGVVVRGVEQVAPDRVTVHYRDVDGDGTTSVDAAIVLGCDGANSIVRASTATSMRDLGFEQRWLVVDVDTTVDLHQWDGVHQVCDSTRPATYMRIGERRYRWEFRLHDHESPADFATVDQLAPLIAPWTNDTDPQDLTLVRVAEYTFRAALADRWRAGRIFVLGDAAHLTPPFIGQGMGAGVRDAANLAWKVAGFLQGSLPADVLDSYEPERSAHAASLVRLACRTGAIMTRGGRPGEVARRVTVPTLARLPGIRRQVTDSATPALSGSGWIAGARADRLAGRLCPNATTRGGRLDDLVGDGWALVTSRAPSPSDADALGRRGCVVVETRADDPLDAWLRDGRVTTALVRPDRTVLASGDVPTLCATVTSLVAPRLEGPST